jgi:hypothetical protein
MKSNSDKITSLNFFSGDKKEAAHVCRLRGKQTALFAPRYKEISSPCLLGSRLRFLVDDRFSNLGECLVSCFFLFQRLLKQRNSLLQS